MSARVLAGVVAAVVLAGGCREADDVTLTRSDPGLTTSTTADAAGPAPTSTTVARAATIEWDGCGGRLECATLDVPLDHGDPDGDTIELGISRMPATGDRLGSLFVNFGGPGGGVRDVIGGFPLPGPITERFDIVGMDPRGVGESTPLRCGVEPTELYSVDPTVEDEADVEALVEVSQRYADDCARRRGELLPHLGTANVARDMDLVRRAMGDDQLSYLGYSYGTSIGQAYAQLFPSRVRAMILDGVVDPAVSGIEAAAEQAEGFETALANWAAGCARRRTCPGDDPIAVVEEVLLAAEAGVPSSGGRRDLGPGEAAVGLAQPLYAESLWSRLDEALSDALDGDGAGMVALADAYVGIVDFSIYFAVSCLDSTWPRNTAAFIAEAEAVGARAPHFGEAIVNDYIRCALWPAPPQPLGAIAAPGTATILVVSTTGDPATPYENGVVVAGRLDDAVLFTNEGEGHTVVFQGKDCIDAVAIRYLVELDPPAPDGRC